MALKLNASQQKLAEKLIILNDRAIGMLTRIYNIKKACGDPKSKPSFLSEKNLENALKQICRKFPTIDTRSSGTTFNHVNAIKADIIKSLSLYYYTFADLLDLKDHITELLTTMDACQAHLDITLNYDLTASYLNLVVNYICLMVLLSRVDDRKAVLGLFNAAYELQHGYSETTFPRLGQMIVDYDSPLKKLAEDFTPLARLIGTALGSLSAVYLRRNITADAWRTAQMLSLIGSPQQLLYAAQTDTIPCEYLSLDTMDRWIIFGLTVCHTSLLNQPVFAELWQRALESGLTVRLFRDEVVTIHPYLQAYFETLKGYNKRLAELKEFQSVTLQQCGLIHRERRKFLRSALKELCLILSDQPGLLGPKILFVFMGLSFARDEASWLLRHVDTWPTGKRPGRSNVDDVSDRQLPELLFHMEELRMLVSKYAQVIQRYYIQYLSGYDAIVLNELIQTLPNVPEDESIILSSFCNSIADLNVEDGALYDFRGLRLDWFRLQAYTSVAHTSLQLAENRRLAVAMNTATFHLKMVDFLDEMLRETSDLSLYCFYTKQLETQFQLCLEFPSQTRYICAFPQLCTHFMNSLHEL
uniref:Nck-associated protein 1 n=3 Tax=Plectus sambesii TaxID=2011161 RepID=A0A914VN14_9BILA